jgi:hypothetical protein
MSFSVPVLLLLQFFLNDSLSVSGWSRFLYPQDWLNREFLQRIESVKKDGVRLVFYINSGDRWQEVGEAFDGGWSGYRTLGGKSYRYARATVFTGRGLMGGERIWAETALLNNIPTAIPGECIPALRPVMELIKLPGEIPRIEVFYGPPVEGLSRDMLVDGDQFLPGNQGDFGAVIIDGSGVETRQAGIDVAANGGTMAIAAAGIGRVILVSLNCGREINISGTDVGGLPVDDARLPAGLLPVLAGYGNSVFVAHPDGYTIRYANLDSVEVAAGQGVLRGTRIGMASVDDDGHVHIEVRWGDPLNPAGSVPMNPWEFFSSDPAS